MCFEWKINHWYGRGQSARCKPSKSLQLIIDQNAALLFTADYKSNTESVHSVVSYSWELLYKVWLMSIPQVCQPRAHAPWQWRHFPLILQHLKASNLWKDCSFFLLMAQSNLAVDGNSAVCIRIFCCKNWEIISVMWSCFKKLSIQNILQPYDNVLYVRVIKSVDNLCLVYD